MKIDLSKSLEEAIKQSYLDGYKKGFLDGYDQANIDSLELPEPKLTGKFSIMAGKFKCSGCTGTWLHRDDAKNHLCRDYQ